MDIKMLMELKDNNLIINIENIFSTLEPVKELKRLQKEIDEAQIQQDNLIIYGWGKNIKDESSSIEFNNLIYVIEQNQLKIKQIIESL